jgi:hypothetical protein
MEEGGKNGKELETNKRKPCNSRLKPLKGKQKRLGGNLFTKILPPNNILLEVILGEILLIPQLEKWHRELSSLVFFLL